MIYYPKIGNINHLPEPNILGHVYQKYDGSNFSMDWARTEGYHRFKSRNQLITAGEGNLLEPAIALFKDKYADELTERLRDLRHCRKPQFCRNELVTLFFEYFGPSSFAGSHVQDDKMELRLIDATNSYILLPPKNFESIFKNISFKAEHLGQENINDEFIQYVRNSTTLGEGVVVKGKHNKNLWRVKIKTDEYKQRLQVYGSKWQEFWE